MNNKGKISIRNIKMISIFSIFVKSYYLNKQTKKKLFLKFKAKIENKI